MSKSVRRFLSDTSGVTIIEFAYIVPLMLLLLLAMVDMGRFILLSQKLDRAASTMSDLVSRPSNISAGEINQLMIAAVEIVQPFDLATQGGVIITSIYKTPGQPARVTWQISGAGPTIPPSSFGATGSPASMPAGFIVRDNENVITAEVYYDYEPIFLDILKGLMNTGDILPEGVIGQTALRQPRLGDLSSLSGP